VSLQATKLARGLDKHLTMTAQSGYSVACDPALCVHCGHCEEKCLFNAVKFHDGQRQYHGSICLGCGLCVEACSGKALTLYADPEKPMPLDLERITATRRYPEN
jgi:heterodisulfide reductase subunit A-like polyferredoxin